MQTETRLKSNVTKSLLKGTIGLACISPFLEINASTFGKYLIFVTVWYALVAAYMVNKGSATFSVQDEGITITRPFRKEFTVPFENIGGVGYSQGILAKRFNCGTVYIELKKGKGSHRSLQGRSVVPMKDVPGPVEVYKDLGERLSPFGAAS